MVLEYYNEPLTISLQYVSYVQSSELSAAEIGPEHVRLFASLLNSFQVIFHTCQASPTLRVYYIHKYIPLKMQDNIIASLFWLLRNANVF